MVRRVRSGRWERNGTYAASYVVLLNVFYHIDAAVLSPSSSPPPRSDALCPPRSRASPPPSAARPSLRSSRKGVFPWTLRQDRAHENEQTDVRLGKHGGRHERTSALRDARCRVSRVLLPSGRAPRGRRVRTDGTRRGKSFARLPPRTPRASRPPSSASGDTGNRRLTSRSSPGWWRRESASSGVLRPRRARRTSPCATGTGTPRSCVSPSTRR